MVYVSRLETSSQLDVESFFEAYLLGDYVG